MDHSALDQTQERPEVANTDYARVLRERLTPAKFGLMVDKALIEGDLRLLGLLLDRFGPQLDEHSAREATIRRIEEGMRLLLLRHFKASIGATGGVPNVEALLAALDAQGVDQFLHLATPRRRPGRP